MNDIDLDLNNYTYYELLNIFKLNNSYNETKHRHGVENIVRQTKNLFPPEISDLYEKSQKIIYTIYKAINKNIINEEEEEIENYIEKIKDIEHFQNYNENELINKITDLAVKSYNKSLHNLSLFNEPYPNVNKFIPGLNNRNNTNNITNTFPNAIAPGELNPVKRLTLNQNLNLNSCFRHNYYQTNPCDFLYMIPIEIKNVLALRLISLEIPNAWYLYSHIQKNNIFQIEIKTNIDTNLYNIVIPDGNYDCDSLQYYLNTTYFYESSLQSNLKFLKFYIDNVSLKTRFEIIETDNLFTEFSFSLKFVDNINQNILNTFGWSLGFRLANYCDIKEKIQSEALFDGGGDRYIYVAINDFQYNNNTLNTVCFDKSILNEEVIAKIPMINGKLSLIVTEDNPLTKIRRYTGPINISKLHIKILDKFGNIIDLNNMDYSITLELEILYESFNFKNVIS
jgi:hypothetical protein